MIGVAFVLILAPAWGLFSGWYCAAAGEPYWKSMVMSVAGCVVILALGAAMA